MWELNSGPVKEQKVLLTTEWPLHPKKQYFKVGNLVLRADKATAFSNTPVKDFSLLGLVSYPKAH